MKTPFGPIDAGLLVPHPLCAFETVVEDDGDDDEEHSANVVDPRSETASTAVPRLNPRDRTSLRAGPNAIASGANEYKGRKYDGCPR